MVNRVTMEGGGVWASAGIVMSQLLPLRGPGPWDGGGNVDLEEESLRRLALIAKIQHEAPHMHRLLRLPQVPLDELWEACPDLCQRLNVPKPTKGRT